MGNEPNGRPEGLPRLLLLAQLGSERIKNIFRGQRPEVHTQTVGEATFPRATYLYSQEDTIVPWRIRAKLIECLVQKVTKRER